MAQKGDYEMKTSYSCANFAYTLYKNFKSVMFRPNQKKNITNYE